MRLLTSECSPAREPKQHAKCIVALSLVSVKRNHALARCVSGANVGGSGSCSGARIRALADFGLRSLLLCKSGTENAWPGTLPIYAVDLDSPFAFATGLQQRKTLYIFALNSTVYVERVCRLDM